MLQSQWTCYNETMSCYGRKLLPFRLTKITFILRIRIQTFKFVYLCIYQILQTESMESMVPFNYYCNHVLVGNLISKIKLFLFLKIFSKTYKNYFLSSFMYPTAHSNCSGESLPYRYREIVTDL